jgi:glycosyltransferase involved in cell wall biosynthesis
MTNARAPKIFATRPIVSVLILAYNHGRYIQQAIESILSQVTDFAIEVVIAEDCSTDETLSISKKFADLSPEIVRVVTGDTNVGMMKNLRRGIAGCRGEFIALCEGDDFWVDAFKLATQVNGLRRHPEIDFCLTRGLLSYPDGGFGYSAGLGDCERILRLADLLGTGTSIQTASFLFRARSIRDLPDWFDSAPVGDLFLIVASVRTTGGALYQPAITACYRVLTDGSWTQRMKQRSAEYYVLHSEAMIKAYESAEVCFDVPKKMLRYHVSGYYWLLAKDRLRKLHIVDCITYFIRIDIAFIIERFVFRARSCFVSSL